MQQVSVRGKVQLLVAGNTQLLVTAGLDLLEKGGIGTWVNGTPLCKREAGAGGKEWWQVTSSSW